MKITAKTNIVPTGAGKYLDSVLKTMRPDPDMPSVTYTFSPEKKKALKEALKHYAKNKKLEGGENYAKTK